MSKRPRLENQDSHSGPHLFSDLSSNRDESASVRTVKISTEPPAQQLQNGKEPWESDEEVLVQPDPDLSLEKASAEQDQSAGPDISGITAEWMTSEPPASSVDDDMTGGNEMNGLLEWINSEQELPSPAKTPAAKTMQTAAKMQSAAKTQTTDSKKAVSTQVGQASGKNSSPKPSHPSLAKSARRVGDITYVLVDDEGKPLLD